MLFSLLQLLLKTCIHQEKTTKLLQCANYEKIEGKNLKGTFTQERHSTCAVNPKTLAD